MSAHISIDGLTITVETGPRLLVPGWGVGGFAPGPNSVQIAVDPSLSEATVANRLPSVAAHELHHVARWRGPGYGATLLEHMVSEGLADHFAADVFGQPLPPWAVALTPGEVDHWLERATPSFDARNFDRNAWFFGNGEIPRWTGYTLGYRLVEDHLTASPGQTAASLVHASAGLFRPN